MRFGAARLRGHGRRAAFVGAVALACAGLIAWLVGADAGFDAVARLLRHADPWWLAACLGGQAVAYAGYSLAYRETARFDGGPRFGLGHAGKVVSAGFAPFLSLRPSGGFSVDARALRAAGLSRAEASRRVLGLGVLEYAVLAPAALGAALALIADERARTPLSMTAPWLLVVPGVLAALWLTAPVRVDRLSSGAERGLVGRQLAKGVSAIALVRDVVVRPHRYGLALVGVALYWCGEIASLWAGLAIFHVSIGIPALVLAYATGYALTRRSVPAGGPGFVEIGLIFALTWTGVPLAAALLGVFAYRLFNYWLAHLPGLVALPMVRELERVPVRAQRR